MGRTAQSDCGERSRLAGGRVVAYALRATAYTLAGDAPFPWRHPSGLSQRRVSPQWVALSLATLRHNATFDLAPATRELGL